MKKVVVYCSSQAGLPAEVENGAEEIARVIFPTPSQLALHLANILNNL